MAGDTDKERKIKERRESQGPNKQNKYEAVRAAKGLLAEEGREATLLLPPVRLYGTLMFLPAPLFPTCRCAEDPME